jgi:pSer/pThr/pTyr-binding forkhead associated (FHA) protein
MLHLHVTDDRGMVSVHRAEQFPVLIGRSPEADIRISAAGVFEEHARLELASDDENPEAKFYLHAVGQSLVLVNGEQVTTRRLIVGDEVSLGAVRAVISLSPPKQRPLALHESTVWVLLAVVAILEAVVIYLAQ